MQNIHFIKVQAENCKDAISKVDNIINIDNEVVDFYNVVGAFNLTNPADYQNTLESSHFSIDSTVGFKPEHFINKVLDCLNADVKPLDEIKQELIELINQVNNETLKSHLPWRVFFKAKALTGNYLITDLIKQNKFENEWSEVGLTDLNDDGENVTHLVLVDFHS
mgnify:FL=1